MKHRRAFLQLLGIAAVAPLVLARQRKRVRHRRVVTANDAHGRSFIVSDGDVPAGARATEQGRSTSDLWLLDRVPAELSQHRDPMEHYELTAWPPHGGAVARIVTWPAGFQYPMHQSDTLDIVFVISGTLELIVESGSTILHAGDSVIQQGTKHSWRVAGSEPATFAGVLLSGTRA